MNGIGWALVAVGTWFIYCGWTGVPPVKTVIQVVTNPAKAQTIVKGAKTKQLTFNSKGEGAVAYCRAQIGKTYWDKDVMGCSGLVTKGYASVGVSLPNWAPSLLAIGEKINSKDDLQIGDLVFPSIPGTVVGHVQIYSGNGNIIEATVPGKPVVERPIWGFPTNKIRASRPKT